MKSCVLHKDPHTCSLKIGDVQTYIIFSLILPRSIKYFVTLSNLNVSRYLNLDKCFYGTMEVCFFLLFLLSKMITLPLLYASLFS
jgi:hypothetical protein